MSPLHFLKPRSVVVTRQPLELESLVRTQAGLPAFFLLLGYNRRPSPPAPYNLVSPPIDPLSAERVYYRHHGGLESPGLLNARFTTACMR